MVHVDQVPIEMPRDPFKGGLRLLHLPISDGGISEVQLAAFGLRFIQAPSCSKAIAQQFGFNAVACTGDYLGSDDRGPGKPGLFRRWCGSGDSKPPRSCYRQPLKLVRLGRPGERSPHPQLRLHSEDVAAPGIANFSMRPSVSGVGRTDRS